MTQRAAANKTFLHPAHCIGCKHTAQLLMQADIIQIFLINSPSPSVSSPAWRSSQVKDLLPLCKRRLGDALGARRAKHTCLKLTFPQDTGHYTFPNATSALYLSPSHQCTILFSKPPPTWCHQANNAQLFSPPSHNPATECNLQIPCSLCTLLLCTTV